MSLVARTLESNGIATVVLGSARDIVEHCGVPRFLFIDFPLGNPCGRPWDADEQRRILTHAVTLLETAEGPRTTVRAPIAWSRDTTWKARYARVDPRRLDEYRRLGEERRAARALVRQGPAPHATGRQARRDLGSGEQID